MKLRNKSAGKRRYGWRPDLPDCRDRMYSAPRSVLRALPASVDLRPQCPSVYDQGELGSCTGNAIAGVHEFCQLKEKQSAFTPSRLFIYYNERSMENTVGSDAGAEIRDGIKSVNTQGVCPEAMWPYDISQFTKKPPAKCYTEGKKHQALKYERIARSLAQMKACLASGFPFVLGFTVYESFESAAVARTGKAPLPKAGEQVLGGHAVGAVGYDDKQGRFTVRNSWGPDWGMKGYFTLPYEFLTNPDLSDDFWSIRIVE